MLRPFFAASAAPELVNVNPRHPKTLYLNPNILNLYHWYVGMALHPNTLHPYHRYAGMALNPNTLHPYHRYAGMALNPNTLHPYHRYAGIGGLSSVLGWTEVQQSENASGPVGSLSGLLKVGATEA